MRELVDQAIGRVVVALRLLSVLVGHSLHVVDAAGCRKLATSLSIAGLVRVGHEVAIAVCASIGLLLSSASCSPHLLLTILIREDWLRKGGWSSGVLATLLGGKVDVLTIEAEVEVQRVSRRLLIVLLVVGRHCESASRRFVDLAGLLGEISCQVAKMLYLV